MANHGDSTKSPAHFDIRLEQPAIAQTPPSEWTTVINKKRLRSPEEEIARKQTSISDYWLQKPIETKNSFSNLSEEIVIDLEENVQPSPEKVVPRPPPITVYEVGVIKHIHDLLKTITKKYTIKTVSYETIKIQLFEADHFKVLVKELDERNTQYHTFRPKSERKFKFVLKGLHHGTDFNTIKVALAEEGHEVNEAEQTGAVIALLDNLSDSCNSSSKTASEFKPLLEALSLSSQHVEFWSRAIICLNSAKFYCPVKKDSEENKSGTRVESNKDWTR
ncbi:uncharacterized protein LOC143193666 [Rhynchophorus ferrugineus]|uniref:uncharacterized protein LOC143193666 n=1 Tax=Rhynchophorus ferrugineus TaxID=354439 RepID=UPI003FCCA0E2